MYYIYLGSNRRVLATLIKQKGLNLENGSKFAEFHSEISEMYHRFLKYYDPGLQKSIKEGFDAQIEILFLFAMKQVLYLALFRIYFSKFVMRSGLP